MKLRPDTKLIDLARSDLLDRLNKRALTIYIRIVAETASQGRRVRMPNRTTNDAAALKELESEGLIKLHYTKHNGLVIDRVIEVL
jgi:hypothetical protein